MSQSDALAALFTDFYYPLSILNGTQASNTLIVKVDCEDLP